MNEIVIELRDVNKSFPVGDTTVQVLKNITLQVRAGEFVAIIGQSGNGKSTLLNMLTGVDRPTSGEVVVARQKLVGMSEDGLALWRRTGIGIVFQFFNLVPGLTLAQNVRLPIDLAATIPAPLRPARVQHLLEHVGLADRLNWMPSRVSSGDQQRAAIARANANDPPIIFGDEATGRQDPRSALACFDLFKQWVAGGKTFLFVTHNRELALQTGRVIELTDGRSTSDQ